MKVAAIGLSLVMALSAEGCPAPEETVHAKVCVNSQIEKGGDTYLRLADSDCDSGQNKARWRYYGGGTSIPAVGGHAPGKSGSWNEPSGTVVHIPRKGGAANANR